MTRTHSGKLDITSECDTAIPVGLRIGSPESGSGSSYAHKSVRHRCIRRSNLAIGGYLHKSELHGCSMTIRPPRSSCLLTWPAISQNQPVFVPPSKWHFCSSVKCCWLRRNQPPQCVQGGQATNSSGRFWLRSLSTVDWVFALFKSHPWRISKARPFLSCSSAICENRGGESGSATK